MAGGPGLVSASLEEVPGDRLRGGEVVVGALDQLLGERPDRLRRVGRHLEETRVDAAAGGGDPFEAGGVDHGAAHHVGHEVVGERGLGVLAPPELVHGQLRDPVGHGDEGCREALGHDPERDGLSGREQVGLGHRGHRLVVGRGQPALAVVGVVGLEPQPHPRDLATVEGVDLEHRLVVLAVDLAREPLEEVRELEGRRLGVARRPRIDGVAQVGGERTRHRGQAAGDEQHAAEHGQPVDAPALVLDPGDGGHHQQEGGAGDGAHDRRDDPGREGGGDGDAEQGGHGHERAERRAVPSDRVHADGGGQPGGERDEHQRRPVVDEGEGFAQQLAPPVEQPVAHARNRLTGDAGDRGDDPDGRGDHTGPDRDEQVRGCQSLDDGRDGRAQHSGSDHAQRPAPPVETRRRRGPAAPRWRRRRRWR